jgi:hypothetical protein
MNSVLQSNSLDEFVSAADMKNQQHQVVRMADAEMQVVNPNSVATVQKMKTNEFAFKHLRIPRKPAWNTKMTAEEVDQREKSAFMEWRREIAGLEEQSSHLKVTPFEKNLEVWRQLWRVMERCGVAFQIVDARNPLLYYTNDLITYGLEHNPPRPVLLLLNKADYLTEYQRKLWAIELESMGIKFAFYSAKSEQDRIDEEARLEGMRLEERLNMMNITAAPIQPYFSEASLPASSSGVRAETVAKPTVAKPKSKLRTSNAEQQRLNNMKVLFEEDSEEEEEDASSAPAVSAATAESEDNDEDDEEDDEDEDEGVEQEEADDSEEEDYLEQHLKWCDDEAVEWLADDLVEQFETNVAIRETLQKAAPKKKKSKKSGAPPTVFVWGNGSESVVSADADKEQEDKAKEKTVGKKVLSSAEYDDLIRRRCRVLTREELILLMTVLPDKMNIENNIRNQGRTCVGLIGYPNVGKSSVINTILGVSKCTHCKLSMLVCRLL